MTRFSISHLLCATVIVATGLLLAVLFQLPPSTEDHGSETLCRFGGGALIGTGLFPLFGRPWLGVIVGAGILLFVLVAAVVYLQLA